MFPRARLIQFARYPVLGRVKTRLRGALADTDILALHRQLVRHTNDVLSGSRLAPVELWHDGGALPADDEFLATVSATRVVQQGEGDLGQRMYRAFCRTLEPSPGLDAAEAAILVGSDCPFIDSDILHCGLEALAGGADAVLGPAEDGGYYLIGLCRPAAEIFANMPWGTATVLAETGARLDALGWRYRLLTELADIDRPDDIPKLTTLPSFAWMKKRNIF